MAVNATERAKDVLREKLIACGAVPEEGLILYPRPNGSFVLSIDTLASLSSVARRMHVMFSFCLMAL